MNPFSPPTICVALFSFFLFTFPAKPFAATLAAGGSHTCAIAEGAGEIRCWGLGSSGQLGNGKLESRAAPTLISSSVRRWIAVETGASHSCGLTAGGGVQCWGSGLYGQLGNGSTADSNLPVDASGLASGVTAIALGSSHSCALMQNGKVNCRGHGGSGRLGTGTTTEQVTPSEVQGLDDVIAIAAGYEYTCALLTTRTVKCWGGNGVGQLGDGSTVQRHNPAAVQTMASGVSQIAAGDQHACALRSGTLYCWGFNSKYQLGDTTPTTRLVPVAVRNLPAAVRSFALGALSSWAVLSDGIGYC